MSFKLSIKDPCTENWNSFEKNGNVGFCSSCQKNVIDFTKYSDREIIEYFKKDKGNTCGRLNQRQLKTYSDEKKSSFNKIAAMLTAAVLALTQAPDAFAQEVVISGRVVDEDNGLLPGAHVIIKGTEQGTSTGSEGDFKLNYQGDAKEIILEFAFIGFQIEERTIDLSKQTQLGDIKLSLDFTGGICVERVGPLRRAWNGITSIFK